MPIGKYVAKRRIWRRIIQRKRRTDHIEDKGAELQRGISKQRELVQGNQSRTGTNSSIQRRKKRGISNLLQLQRVWAYGLGLQEQKAGSQRRKENQTRGQVIKREWRSVNFWLPSYNKYNVLKCVQLDNELCT